MKRRPTTYVVFVHLVVVVLGVEVYLLSMQNKQLKTEIAKPQIVETLKSGDVVPQVLAYDMEGKEKLIDYSDSTKLYVLFVFSTKCQFCEENLPNWLDISKRVDRSRVFIIGISIQDVGVTKSYSQGKGLPFIVLASKDKSFSKDYKINVVPQTLLVGVGGIIKNIWKGVLTDSEKIEILGSTGKF